MSEQVFHVMVSVQDCKDVLDLIGHVQALLDSGGTADRQGRFGHGHL